MRALANSNIGHQYIDFVRLAAVARLTEVVSGSELEVVGSREDDEDEEYEVDVVSGDDVCDEDVRARAVEEVGGLEESEEGSEEDTTDVVEEEKNTEDDDDDDALSLREGLLDVVDVLTLTLDEVGAAVLLA